MEQYVYAVSVVARNGDAINNLLDSGFGDFGTMIRDIETIKQTFQYELKNNIALLNCNLIKFGGTTTYKWQFRDSYIDGPIEGCIDKLVFNIYQTIPPHER